MHVACKGCGKTTTRTRATQPIFKQRDDGKWGFSGSWHVYGWCKDCEIAESTCPCGSPAKHMAELRMGTVERDLFLCEKHYEDLGNPRHISIA